MSKITDVGAALDPQFERVSDTPRTDAATVSAWGITAIPVEFSRQLERELAEARNDALEEAAQVCDSESSCEGIAQKCAAAIRAMKEGEK